MFKNLQEVLEELSHYKRDRSYLEELYINRRLNENLEVYYKELSNSILYLSRKSESKILKKMNEEDKNE